MRAAWWWVDRWRKSTAYTDLTLSEQGAYRNLLDELWLREGVLPNDQRILAKVCGDAVEWPKVRDKVLARFHLTDEGWRNVTHDEIAQESRRRADKQKRYRERRRGVTGNVTGDVTRSPSPSPSPSIRHITEPQNDSARERWDEIKAVLKGTIPSHSWSTWIRPTQGWGWELLKEGPEEGYQVIVVTCPPGQHLLHICDNYGDRIRSLLATRGVAGFAMYEVESP
jgi:uncharacterized protein YdaU (DUF1376 family)